ncbi:ATP-binding cassette domain-containing protein [Azorhizobium caulinodans]
MRSVGAFSQTLRQPALGEGSRKFGRKTSYGAMMLMRESPDDRHYTVSATGVWKKRGGIDVLRGLDMYVRRGERYGIMGTNGAGKSSLINIILGLTPPDRGTVTVFGKDMRRQGHLARARIGVVPQDDCLEQNMTPYENVMLYGRLCRMTASEARKRADQIFEKFSMMDCANRPVRLLSGGMRRLTMVARALVNDPYVIILDEATVGLDAKSRSALWQQIEASNATGATVLVISHLAEDLERMTDRIACICAGTVRAEWETAALLKALGALKILEIDHSVSPRGKELFCNHGLHVHENDGRLSAVHPSSDFALEAVLKKEAVPTTTRFATLDDIIRFPGFPWTGVGGVNGEK